MSIALQVPNIGSLFRSLSILFDDYKESTTAYVTTTFATLPWILFGVTNNLEFAAIAVLLHIVPPLAYYQFYGPFGIKINYTPTKHSKGQKEPDKVSERKDEAMLTDGRGSIFVNMEVSNRLDSFSIQFFTPDEIDVELRDIPRGEHKYNREENILSCQNMSQNEFSAVLEIFVTNPVERRREYPLKIKDTTSGKSIKNITLIDS